MKVTDEGAEYYLQNAVAENAKHDAEELEIMLQKAIQCLPEKAKIGFHTEVL
jgi:RNA polymerase sigma-70 factor (ECF subfamily)